MNYETFDLHPVSGALGAEISGIDLSQPLDEAVAAEVAGAWLEYLVLFFRDQDLTPAQFKAFAQLFGDIEVHPFIRSRVDEEPDVEALELAKTPPMAPPTSILHIDLSSSEVPTKGTVLYAVDVPAAGGDTIWVNAYAAYEALSKPMKERWASRNTSLAGNARQPFMRFDMMVPRRQSRRRVSSKLFRGLSCAALSFVRPIPI